MIWSGDWLGLAVVLSFVLVVTVLIAMSRTSPELRFLLIAALLMRVVGAGARYYVNTQVYVSGDATRYYNVGWNYAEWYFLRFDFTPLWQPPIMVGGTWTGTTFMFVPSGLVLALIGPTMLGEYIVFSLFAFVGVCGFVLAFRRAYPHLSMERYLMWVAFFPALLYWPSSVGKESLILMGLGVAVAGFIGRQGRINWLLLAIGMFFVFAIRPQVAAVLGMSMVVAQWIALGERWSFGRVVQGMVIVSVGLAGVAYSLSVAGVETLDSGGLQEYMEDDAARRVGGGSSIEAVPLAVAGIPLALVNILARPFLWEADSALIMLAALEVAFVWFLILRRRKNVIGALRRITSDRFIALAIIFIAVYAVAIGLLVTNLGIIARQRILLWPFIFMLIEVAGRPAEAAVAAPSPGAEARPRRPALAAALRR